MRLLSDEITESIGASSGNPRAKIPKTVGGKPWQ
jgi:hypothetical protein